MVRSILWLVALACANCCVAVEVGIAPGDPPKVATKAGMTWGVALGEAPAGVVLVGCHGLPKTAAGSCEAYVGDTACTTALPVLCVNIDGRAPPPGLKTGFYAGWLGGRIALAPGTRGDAFENRAAADGYCASHFGAGWRMGEHHDRRTGSGGWSFYGVGAGIGANLFATRFWTAINDTQANCWDRSAAQLAR